MSLKLQDFDEPKQKQVLGRMLREMISQLPLEEAQFGFKMLSDDEKLEIKLYELMHYYNNIMNFKVFTGITAKIIE